MMEFKPDWEEAMRRFEAWWEGEILDRVCIQVTAPRAGAKPRSLPVPARLEERWTNIEYVLDVAEERMRTTFYGGEAFPLYWPNLGPDVFAAYLGAELIFAEGTSWAKPLIEDWATAPPLRFDRENRWWKLTLQMTEAALERALGRYFVGLTDLHGGLDALAALRGQQNLCLDLIERPDKVKEAMAFLTPLWFTIYEEPHRLIQRKLRGSSTWIGLWSPGKMYPVSCDFICLISPSMGREFVLPDIVAEIEWLDHSIYHLDGPGALPHLDALLEIPQLGGIQWVPGAGSPPTREWVPLLKRIQAAGKNLHLGVAPQDIESLLEQISPRGVMFRTHCASEQEARALLKQAERWAK